MLAEAFSNAQGQDICDSVTVQEGVVKAQQLAISWVALVKMKVSCCHKTYKALTAIC